jgi:hypothetical protein
MVVGGAVKAKDRDLSSCSTRRPKPGIAHPPWSGDPEKHEHKDEDEEHSDDLADDAVGVHGHHLLDVFM